MSTETDDYKKSVFKALKRMENLQLSKDDLLGMQKHLEEMTVKMTIAEHFLIAVVAFSSESRFFYVFSLYLILFLFS